MSQRALAAELIGTFMLMSSVLGAAFYSFGAAAGAAGILGGVIGGVIARWLQEEGTS